MRAKSSAKHTIDILKQGFYIINNQRIDISAFVERSVKNSIFVNGEYFERNAEILEQKLKEIKPETRIIVKNCTSMEAVQYLPENKCIGCLNFASAKNPGGGFLNGAQAQEESLSRASALYPTQIKFFKEMYEYNRFQNTYLYSDNMIYSPEVAFFKDDREELISKPYKMDILTCPAVNIGAMINNKRLEEMDSAKDTMLKRIDKLLATFFLQGASNLILGAWGCGVFRNDPKDVANYFAHYLMNDGKYAHAFEKVIFAVYDKSKNIENFKAFEDVFA